MSTFITRSLSAIVFIVVMVGCIWWNIYSFQLLFVFICAGCMNEYIKLCEKIIPDHTFTNSKRLFLILYSILMLSAMLLNKHVQFIMPFLLVLILLLPVILFALEMTSKRFNILTVVASIGGLFYITFSLALINFMSWGFNEDESFSHLRLIVLSVLWLIWTNDTMAYITGALIGKRPFMPHISPKKTWEGIIGGILFTALMAWLLKLFLHKYNIIFQPWWAIGPAVSVLATLGDLAESMLKRQAQVKDSGSILPGHGGFLDRFDAMLFALPPVLIYVLNANPVFD